jgi:hypothetical protein
VTQPGSKAEILVVSTSSPLFLQQRTLSDVLGTSALGQFRTHALQQELLADHDDRRCESPRSFWATPSSRVICRQRTHQGNRAQQHVSARRPSDHRIGRTRFRSCWICADEVRHLQRTECRPLPPAGIGGKQKAPVVSRGLKPCLAMPCRAGSERFYDISSPGRQSK